MHRPPGFPLVAITLLGLKFRKRPKRLVIREMPSITFMHALPIVRDRIKTTFEGHEIDALSMVTYELHNEGSETIRDATFVVTLPTGSKVLDAALKPPDPQRKCVGNQDNIVRVSFPYLNPLQEHKQILQLMILADGETEHAKITGEGDGWSVRYVPLPGPKQLRRRLRILMLIGAVVGLAELIYVWYIGRVLGIGPNEWSGRAFVALLPIVVVAFGFTFALSRFVTTDLKRILSRRF
jgi:hypothetical protein